LGKISKERKSWLEENKKRGLSTAFALTNYCVSSDRFNWSDRDREREEAMKQQTASTLESFLQQPQLQQQHEANKRQKKQL